MKLISRIIALVIVLSINITHSAQDVVPFTVQVDTEQAPIQALYQAYYGTTPTIVEAGADLIVTHDYDAIPDDYFVIPHHFLADTFIILQSENPEAHIFANFTISPDGQQVLIDAGFLPDSVTVVDQTGHEIIIPQPVRGAVTPYGIATALIYTVGAQDRLLAGDYLGVDDPTKAERMALFDDNYLNIYSDTLTDDTINLEAIALLNPDVIFASSRASWLDDSEQLNAPTILLDVQTPELLQEALYIVGQVFGPHASAVSQVWTQYYHAINLQVLEDTRLFTEENRPRVLMVGENVLQVISGEMYATDLIEIAGGVSVSENLNGDWNDVGIDNVLLWNPDLIVIASDSDLTVEALTESQEWQVIDAVRDGNVHKMPSWVIAWDIPVPDSILGIVWLSEILFDEQIGLSCSWEVEFFYSIFYNYTIADEDINALCQIG